MLVRWALAPSWALYVAMQRTLELETAPGDVTPDGNAYGSIPRLSEYDVNGASYGDVEFRSVRQ
jgi:hypothetical protein